MTCRVHLEDNERGTESAEDAVARVRHRLQLGRQLLCVGVVAAAALVPLAIFALPGNHMAVGVVATLVSFPAFGGIASGPWVYLSAPAAGSRLTRLPRARVVQRYDR